MTACSAPVFVGDETWFYYGAKQQPEKLDDHGNTWSHVTTSAGLACIRRGRYAGFQVRSGSDQGTLRTVPVSLPGPRLPLQVNAACTARDTLRVEAVDAKSGKALLGVDDCEPIVGDGIGLAVRWRRPMSAASREPIALVFHFTGKARLYGLRFGS
jgi:hypothetical protein